MPHSFQFNLLNRNPAGEAHVRIEYVAGGGGQLVGPRRGHAVCGMTDGDVKLSIETLRVRIIDTGHP